MWFYNFKKIPLDNQKKLTNEAYNEYLELAKKLSINRIEVSQKLINEVNDELPALKLENAKFSIIINPLQDTLFSSKGIDDVKFYAQTNKDTKLGKISEIADWTSCLEFDDFFWSKNS